jgi:TetR/AcrR family transcriptional regulator, fatty acid metabolism regulator protein
MERLMRDDAGAQAGVALESLAPTQLRIVRSAYKVMGMAGGASFSLQEVADDAGVSKALLIYHFKSKEGLALAALEWALKRVAERIVRAIDPIETAERKVEVMLDAIFARADQNRHFYLVYAELLGHAARLESYGAVATTFHETVNAMYAEVAALGMREGVFTRRDSQEAAVAMRALIDGMFLQWLLERDWRGTHAAYRALCKQAILAYLRSA